MRKTTDKGLRVLGLKIQNLRNIEIVEVDLRNRTFVEIRGKNGSAKTSLIDGIFGAIVGTKHFGKSAWRVIKQGKDKALMKVVIGNDQRQIEIRRSITKKTDEKGVVTTGGSLLIQDTDGGTLGQAFLNGLLSEFTVNPLAFAKRLPKEQIEIVKELGGINTDKIEKAHDATFQDRTIENRELKRLDSLVKSLKCEKAEPVKMKDLFAERQTITDYNIEQDNRERDRIEYTASIDREKQDSEQLETEIKRIQDQLISLQNRKVDKLESINEGEKFLKNMAKPEERKSFDAIDRAISNAGKVNENAEKYRQYQDAVKRQLYSKESAEQLTARLKDLEKEKKDMILSSKLPFKNIEFDDDAGILIDTIPFSQKSSAEQLRISTRVGMEMRPDLRILFIEGGSLLDEESFEIIKELAFRHEYQVLIESVGEQPGEDMIVLRAGSIVSAFEKQDTIAAKARKLDTNL